MKFFFLAVLCCCLRAAVVEPFAKTPMCLSSISQEKQRVETTQVSAFQSSTPSGQNNADDLLKMVDSLSSIEGPDSLSRIQQLERALTELVELEKRKIPPKPPSFPPDQSTIEGADISTEQENFVGNDKIAKAEIALNQLRQRLREEEEIMRKAEAALQRSKMEEETLRRAEEALKRSRLAAEERKADAIRRTNEAVAEAAQIRKEQLEIAKQAEQIQKELSQKQLRPRRTFDLDSLFNNPSNYQDYNGADEDDSVSNGAAPPSTKVDSIPEGIPVLYNWSQREDGSIAGRVRGSGRFFEGAKISTSPVSVAAEGGMVVTTATGSRYYLEKVEDTARSMKESSPPKVDFDEALRIAGDRRAAAKQAREAERKALQVRQQEQAISEAARAAQEEAAVLRSEISANEPTAAGGKVPQILNWSLRQDGGISGQVYGAQNTVDGDQIETSPLLDGSRINDGEVVETISGNRYFLSNRKALQTSSDGSEDSGSMLQDIAATARSTITLPGWGTSSGSPSSTANAPSNGQRTTFSLFDMFSNDSKQKKKPKLLNNPPQRNPRAPPGVATLSLWRTNRDGTITGFVSGSAVMDDGDLITTSVIVEGVKQKHSVVTTKSGSRYYLG